MPKRPSPLATISRELSRAVDRLDTEKAAAFTYNPLAYARAPHEDYLEKYGAGKKEVLLLGMNPGPFGMAQTGVPFGDVGMVRDFLKVSGKVGRPKKEHPKRVITGFACPRSEVSGTRLWSFAKEHFKTPDRFFKRFFVVNYCPLVFMEESGKNLTPDKLPRDIRDDLNLACDHALQKMVLLMEPQWVLGVGAFAQKQAERALSTTGVRIGTILHPSPASPRANRGWSSEVERQLEEMSIRVP
jgi:single-strand selective monofunctional uracil DNA glycosylase